MTCLIEFFFGGEEGEKGDLVYDLLFWISVWWLWKWEKPFWWWDEWIEEFDVDWERTGGPIGNWVWIWLRLENWLCVVVDVSCVV